jgi:transposase
MDRWARLEITTVPKPSSNSETIKSPAEQNRAAKGVAVESVSPRRRRSFPAAERLRILKLADACRAGGERGAVEAMMRAEGIYSSQLSGWRAQLTQHGVGGLGAKKPGRKLKLDAKDHRNLALEKRNAVLERELHIAKALIELQKKAHELLGIACPTLEGTV